MATFTYKKKREDYLSPEYYSAQERMKALEAAGYDSRYAPKVADALSAIENREAFKWDANSDALYRQYKDAAVRDSRRVAADVAGQAAALTGGYGNSYAATAANQAAQNRMAQLGDRMIDLYQLAADRYDRQTNDLYNRYSLYRGEDDSAYNRYQSELARLAGLENNYYSRASNDYATDYGNAYNLYSTDLANERAAAQLAEEKRQYDSKMAYQREQDALERQLSYAKMAQSDNTAALKAQIDELTAQLAEKQDMTSGAAVTQKVYNQIYNEVRKLGETDEESAMALVGSKYLEKGYKKEDVFKAIYQATGGQKTFIN